MLNDSSQSPLTLLDLADRADVSPRTVRYYVTQGLLPPPEGRGPGSHWTEGHLARLELIKALQAEHLPLAEIRARLDSLDDEGVRAALRRPRERGPRDALSYVREVLAGGAAPWSHPSRRLESSRPEPTRSERTGQRATWERITLAPDVELHVRRPLSRTDRRLVEAILDLAHHRKDDPRHDHSSDAGDPQGRD